MYIRNKMKCTIIQLIVSPSPHFIIYNVKIQKVFFYNKYIHRARKLNLHYFFFHIKGYVFIGISIHTGLTHSHFFYSKKKVKYLTN